MNSEFYREYRFKFYLNANHFIIINGKEGQQHPHTWEFSLNIAVDKERFVQFDEYEKAIDEYFEIYQNRLMNAIAPFDQIVPTLENMTEYFVVKIDEIVKGLGGQLMSIESSETPTRSYVISLESQSSFMEHMKQNSEEKTKDVIDSVLNRIIK